MLDRSVQQKGGFGAAAERAQDRRAARTDGAAAADGTPNEPEGSDAAAPAAPAGGVERPRGRGFTPRG